LDDPPAVANPIDDITADEDSDPGVIDLSLVFADVDNDDSDIVKTALDNSNPDLVSAATDGNILTIEYLENQNGTASITIRGESNGKTTDHTFTVTVNPVDDRPTIANPIDDITADEDSDPGVIDLSLVFADVDNDDSNIVKTVHENSNPDLVTAIIYDDTLSLVYQPDQSGAAEITIRGESNGKTIDDTFTVIVNPVDDPPTVANPIDNIAVDRNSDPTIIDLSQVFTDIDDDFDIDIVKTVHENSNPDLVSAAIDGNTLTLEYQANENGIANITIRGESNGKTIDDTFTVAVYDPFDIPPEVQEEIEDIIVDKNSDTTTIDLSQLFTDTDDNISDIVKTVLENTNPALVTATIDGNTLTLEYQADLSGTASITVQGQSNGRTVEDTFIVNVDIADSSDVGGGGCFIRTAAY